MQLNNALVATRQALQIATLQKHFDCNSQALQLQLLKHLSCNLDM
jgi:hypothetical protein